MGAKEIQALMSCLLNASLPVASVQSGHCANVRSLQPVQSEAGMVFPGAAVEEDILYL
jgi:hypothetical protein